jgi:uncharacterized repeat protein (TIGR01451 family)
MRKRRCITGLCAGLLLLAGGTANAAPALRVQVDQKGDFVLLGNTLGQECATGTPLPVVPPAFDFASCGTAATLVDSAPDVFWRADQPSFGLALADPSVTALQARSTAILALPPSAAVTHAFLYWAATLPTGAVADPSVQLERTGSGGFLQTINAITSIQLPNGAYQSVADVTSVVKSRGPGPYRVSDVTAANLVNISNNNNFAGWWMVVFYELATAPQRNLALFDGFDAVFPGNNQTVTLSGFQVPNAGFDGKLGVVTFEGDNQTTGDGLNFNSSPLSDTQNPVDNFFNSTRSLLGAAVSVVGDLPQLKGTPQSMSGIDIDVVNISSKLTAGDKSATIQATTTGDNYFLAGFVTAITTIKPDFSTATKTAADLNGGALLVGDVLEYTIVAANTGNDSSINTVLKDALPAGVSYVPGSLKITQGVGLGSKTDAAGDDQAEYDAATKTVIFRLGTGASSTQGGQLAPGGSSTVKFQVKVAPGATGTIANQASISAAGLLGAPVTTDLTDGNGAADGSPPTTVIIDLCADDAQCSAPTPHCDVTPNPNVCVECVNSTHCSGSKATCDLPTKTCICVASGAEICDGKDNDCNGTVDDGFNAGTACTLGQGVCQSSGTIVCDAMGGSKCNAIPGEPSPEACDDVLDSDCDGNPNNGCPDQDGDGLSDTYEPLIGTNPEDADSDDDGVPDGQEPSVAEDSDGDGLINALDPDSDNDGLLDGTELGKNCSDPATDTSKKHCIADADMGATTTNPLDPDTDDGGVGDGSEDSNLDGRIDPGETDPTEGHGADDSSTGNVDTDGDGLSDNLEETIGTDPSDADSDDDGVIDGEEPNPNLDNDGDGLFDALDPDSDNDGLFDGTELGKDCSDPATDMSKKHCIPDADSGSTQTSPLDWDTDNGGISDGSEDSNLNGKIDAGELNPTTGHGDDDSQNIDHDSDGLSDALEMTIGTDPNDADSDDDGVPDGAEPNPADDTDGDGKTNALDPDSDNDGLFDGTELGKNCNAVATDQSKGNCTPDADANATTTGPLTPDTDHGGIGDGVEDANHNGKIDPGELDPNNPADDTPCTADNECGDASSGRVCDDAAMHICIDGCRGTNGNGCPDGTVCTSTDETIGTCTSSGAGGNGGGSGGGNGSGGAEPDGFVAEGNGILCSAQPGNHNGTGFACLIAGALGALMALRRRRRG